MIRFKLLPLALLVILASSLADTAFSQDFQAVSAKDFWLEFEADREKAEARYVGRTMNFTGVVTDTGTSIYLTPNVMLSDGADGRTYLICVLPRADAGRLADFKKGDLVTMNGRVYRAKAGGGVVIKESKKIE